jgi:hypothetical protein
MGRPRVHLATMLGLVLFCAVGLAAMRYASDGWATFCFSLALGVLGWAIVPLLLRRGPRRAYWIGFNALGWGYLVACFGPWCEEHVQPHLATTRLIEQAAPFVVHPRVLTIYQLGQNAPRVVNSVLAVPADITAAVQWGSQDLVYYSGWPSAIQTKALAPGDPANVQRIGHSLLALVVAAIGGAAGRWLGADQAASATS